jgi:hypothetical protein
MPCTEIMKIECLSDADPGLVRPVVRDGGDLAARRARWPRMLLSRTAYRRVKYAELEQERKGYGSGPGAQGASISAVR